MIELGYNPFNPPILNYEDLVFTNLQRLDYGYQKYTLHATHAGVDLAAKIYNTHELVKEDGVVKWGEEQDQERLAIGEFALYRSLVQTPLGAYIPEAHALIANEVGKIVGLAVAWIDGNELSKFWGSKRLLVKGELEGLKRAILATADLGIYPSFEMLREFNILFARNSQQRLWLAECVMENQENKDPDLYKDIANRYYDGLGKVFE